MVTAAYIVGISFFAYLIFGFLTSYSIKCALSRHRCDCNKMAIKWRVPFDPVWIFSLSGELHQKYLGRCESCGRSHQAKIESKQTTFSIVTPTNQQTVP